MSAGNPVKRIGVLLAAGRGRRMGQTKQLIPWGCSGREKPLVSAAYDAIRPICDEMVVVLGHESDRVATALGNRVFRRAEANPDADMFESVRVGVATAVRIAPLATVVLQPADHPEVALSTLEALIDASERYPALAIVPEFHGRGGHPVLIPPAVIALLAGRTSAGGLRQMWLDYPDVCRRLNVSDPGVLHDLDTPDQLLGR